MEQQPIKRDAQQPVTNAPAQPLTNAPKSNTDKPNDSNATTPGTKHGPTELQHGDREAGDVRRTDIEFGSGTPKVATPVTTGAPTPAAVPSVVAKT